VTWEKISAVVGRDEASARVTAVFAAAAGPFKYTEGLLEKYSADRVIFGSAPSSLHHRLPHTNINHENVPETDRLR
jgi:hypothetical protein